MIFCNTPCRVLSDRPLPIHYFLPCYKNKGAVCERKASCRPNGRIDKFPRPLVFVWFTIRFPTHGGIITDKIIECQVFFLFFLNHRPLSRRAVDASLVGVSHGSVKNTRQRELISSATLRRCMILSALWRYSGLIFSPSIIFRQFFNLFTEPHAAEPREALAEKVIVVAVLVGRGRVFALAVFHRQIAEAATSRNATRHPHCLNIVIG